MTKFMTISELVAYFRLSKSTIKGACQGRNVNHIGDKYDLYDFKKKLFIK
jgi:hypothetical protein